MHERVIEAIVRLARLSEQDRILEVGPGLGFVTRRLVGAEREVWAVEVDPLLVRWLSRSPLGSHAGFHLVHGDLLEADLDLFLPAGKVKVVANLPYSIAAPALLRLFDEGRRFSLLVVMLQKEVARRLIAAPGTPSYGALSVWSRLYGRVTDRVPVAPAAFTPRPRVDSTLLRIEMLDPPLLPAEEMAGLHTLVRAGFGQRRKMLGNALAALFGSAADAIFENAAVDPRRRAETLDVYEFGRLARAFREAGR